MSSTTATMYRHDVPIFDITFDSEDGALEGVASYCPFTGDTIPCDIEKLPLYTASKIEEFIANQLALNDEPADNYDHDDFLEKEVG